MVRLIFFLITEQISTGARKKICFALNSDSESFLQKIRSEFGTLQDIDFQLYRCGPSKRLEPFP